MSRVFFVTFHGTLLVQDEAGRIAHQQLRAIPDIGALLSVEADIASLRQDYAGFLTATPPGETAVTIPHLGGATLQPDRVPGTVHLQRDGRFLLAGPDGGNVGWSEAEPNDWERLLPVSDLELAQLVSVFSNDWVLRSSRAMVRGYEIRLAPRFTLMLGTLAVPLAGNLPLGGGEWPFRFTALVDGWRIEQACLFRPLVTYAAFRSPAVHAQLFLSLQSLVEFGRYDGVVHVATDLSHDAVCRGAGVLAPDKVTVQHLEPTDFAGFVGAKYAILEQPSAWQHQPICYLDPDIVINANIRAMLVEMTVADTLTAPMEEVGPMRTWPSVGATLLQRDGHDPRFANGFNAGTLGIPNLRRHGETLALIRRIIVNLLASEGRESLEWVDQEVANYVSFRLAHIDTTVLNRFVRYGNADDASRPGPRTGLVHFWASGKQGRDDVMRRYMDVLRDTDAVTHKLSS